MRLLRRIVTSGGVAAFFFFAWVIMMLWNSIIVGHLELTKPLSYLQTCGLWFMITLFLAWTGIGMGGVRLWWWGGRMRGRRWVGCSSSIRCPPTRRRRRCRCRGLVVGGR